MAWSVDDLSMITDLLITELTDAVHASAIWQANNFSFNVSGAMPGTAQGDGLNTLSVYLLHVGRDPSWRNTPVAGNKAQLNRRQPLSLNLSYLLTSYADENWMLEQQLMSIALACFHATPIYVSKPPMPLLEFTVTVEADSIEEMSRLWQAIAAPIRMSAMFRVAVVFLSPPDPPEPDSRNPLEATLSLVVNPASPGVPAPPPAEPVLLDVATQGTFAASPALSPPSGVDGVMAVIGPAIAVGGGSVRVVGRGLDLADAAAVFLTAGGAEWPVPAAWRVAPDLSSSAGELKLVLPAAYAPTPASGTALLSTPLPGAYGLRVGNTGTVFRSNTVTVTIAPRVDGIGNGAPVLAPDTGGTYTLNVAGMVDGATTLLLSSTALTNGVAAAPGVAAIDMLAGTVAFQLPSPSEFVSRSYVEVRVVVNGVEASPGWWVLAP